MTRESCPFCELPEDRVFHRGGLVSAIWDAFPVARGHALIIPHRHVATWFDASSAEHQEILRTIDVVRRIIDDRYMPDGYNIGVNVGEAAGQTVFHLHVHVIPRYDGDVPDPTGGVRHVIPEKGNYRRGEVSRSNLLGDLPHQRSLIRGWDDPFLPHLLAELDRAERADFAVAFVLKSGIQPLLEHLRDLLDRNGRIRLLTGDYLDVTEPEALLELMDLRGQIEIRAFQARNMGFHPKAYLFYRKDGSGIAYVGSSNLTQAALNKGVEWNYRVLSSAEHAGFGQVADAFEELFQHPDTCPVDFDWIQSYQARRQPGAVQVIPEVAPETPEPPPAPHEVQRAALARLQQTRRDGNSAGLVVLATGLGKTWLAAFDSYSDNYSRILFVAHREEILSQAMKTFRRIRPNARLGRYTGAEKCPEADVLFASIQTLGRRRHLDRFDPRRFDYIVVDEFHHAAAKTYRRMIDYFEPKFLLGLTATPERMDGGDLLSLCQENLVFRNDILDGIKAGLLCPFRYFGVPDEVDYQAIPWRSSRFDEEALTAAVATKSRAENALQQYRKHGGSRTLAFCCSQRHADFMSQFFRNAGVSAVAVHSGGTSAPRATSLARLESGDLSVVFAVDMFNEGIDIPQVDTVMMLRPTQSSTIWLQQFGRGLRKAPQKECLTVVDYIGNHRVFLVKARALLQQLPPRYGSGDADIAAALQIVQSGKLDLPPGCAVTYELEAVDILTSMLRRPHRDEAIRAFYVDFRERHGERPTAVELLHEGYTPRSLRGTYGSWMRFVNAMGDLSENQQRVLEQAGDFLDVVETTPMTKSFKMLTLLALLHHDALPGTLSIEAMTESFGRLASRSAILRADVGAAINDNRKLQSLIERNPIKAWVGGRGSGGRAYFSYQGSRFSTTFDIPSELLADFQELVREIIDWRLAEYLQRPSAQHRTTE